MNLIQIKSSSPDGFLAKFYQQCWNFIGKDVWKVAKDFRKKKMFVKDMNNTMITLILNKKACTKFSDFKLISLRNTIYKIIMKTIANIFKKNLDKIILVEQNGFVPGREISEIIIIETEMAHLIQKSRCRGMIIKLDINKTYDRVEWGFLLENFGEIRFCRRLDQNDKLEYFHIEVFNHC